MLGGAAKNNGQHRAQGTEKADWQEVLLWNRTPSPSSYQGRDGEQKCLVGKFSLLRTEHRRKIITFQQSDCCLIFQVPKLEFVLQRCPNLEHLTLSFGMRSVDVTQQEMESLSTSTSQRPLASLKSFTVHTYMTKRALEYLWTRAINLVRS